MSGVLRGQVILLLLMHLFGDGYGAFYYPLIPFLRERLGLTLTATAALATLLMGCMSYSQPLAGVIENRIGQRATLVVAMVAAATGAGLLGVAWNLPTLCVVLVLCGLGVGLFHPVGAAVAGRGGRDKRTATIAIYMVGGNIGVMLAPLLVPRVAAQGFPYIATLAIPGLIFAAVLWARLRVEDEPPRARSGLADAWPVFRRLWPIHLDVVLRFIPITAYLVLLPMLATLRGQSKTEAGQALAFVMLAGAVGVLAGGYLGRRFSSRRLVILSEFVAGTCWVLAPIAHGALFYLLLGVGSFLVYAVLPIQIAVAQRLAPESESAASGIVMGFAYGNAGLALLPLGWLGDRWTAATGSVLISVTRMLQVSALCLLVAAVASLAMRSGQVEPQTGPVKG